MNVIRYPATDWPGCCATKKSPPCRNSKAPWAPPSPLPSCASWRPWDTAAAIPIAAPIYTLDSIAQYDERGLWSYRDIHFSRHGTLLNTAATLVTNAPAGYFTDELDDVVQVATKDALRHLVQQDRLYRRELAGRYLYCAKERQRRQEQWAARQAQQQSRG